MAYGLVALVFAMGAAVGSFVSVLIYRTLRGMNPYKGRSMCDYCKRQLAWYENVPLLSYVVLRGKCRTCKKKIDWSYPLVEFMTGVLFVWWLTLGFAFFRLSSFPLAYLQPIFWLVVGTMLLLIFFADLMHGIIPDLAIGVIGLLGLFYRSYLVSSSVMQVKDFLWSFGVGIVAMGFFWTLHVATKGRGMGFGDVKFSLIMGFILGFPKGLVGFFVSFVVGGVVGAMLLLVGKRKVGQTVPFGPFLVVGFVVALVWGEQLWSAYYSLLSGG